MSQPSSKSLIARVIDSMQEELRELQVCTAIGNGRGGPFGDRGGGHPGEGGFGMTTSKKVVSSELLVVERPWVEGGQGERGALWRRVGSSFGLESVCGPHPSDRKSRGRARIPQPEYYLGRRRRAGFYSYLFFVAKRADKRRRI